MNSYIKYIIEGFDFDSINKKKSTINAHDIIFKYRLNEIVQKILHKSTLNKEDKSFILTLPTKSYQTNNNEIKKLTKKCIKIFGNNCNLNWIDTSNVTNMKKLFCETKFNGDVSNWDVSNVTNMNQMFHNSRFNGDVSNWDVSNVTDMHTMFGETPFNGDVSKWNVSNVKDM